MKIPPINTKRFYFIGKWCFLVMAIMSLTGWIDSLSYALGIDIIKSLASTLFTFALFGFFSWMHGKEVGNAKTPNLNDDEMKALSKVMDTADLSNLSKVKKK